MVGKLVEKIRITSTIIIRSGCPCIGSFEQLFYDRSPRVSLLLCLRNELRSLISWLTKYKSMHMSGCFDIDYLQ